MVIQMGEIECCFQMNRHGPGYFDEGTLFLRSRDGHMSHTFMHSCGLLQNNLLMHWIQKIHQSVLAAVTNNPNILVAKKNTSLFIVYGSTGWLGFARLSWAWIQVLGLIHVCYMSRLRNSSDLRHAFCMMNDKSTKVTFAHSRHTVTSPYLLLVKASHKTRPKVNWVEMFTWQTPTAKPNGKSCEFIILLQEGSEGCLHKSKLSQQASIRERSWSQKNVIYTFFPQFSYSKV